MKNNHEVRDPIHVFIGLDTEERKVLDSPFFQRLRNIHQLSLTHLIYPGATHKRFEHSLGVMELATRVFDIVTDAKNITDNSIKDAIPEITSEDKRRYWRRVLRMAALCHDIGHLPFSHAAESLLPDGWNHERITVDIIESDDMNKIWESITPALRPEHIAKLAVGPKHYRKSTFTLWESILSEIIVGDGFGVDRMDYLLRDSHHVGVAYGKFDHYRLIDTLRILPSTRDSYEPSLGIEEGGLHSAEALLLARYFMFEQVYLHPIRRIYDLHLAEFLKKWLGKGVFPTSVDEHTFYDDVIVLNGIKNACKNANDLAHDPALRIQNRKHYKVVYSLIADDLKKCENPGKVISQALIEKYGTDAVKQDNNYKPAGVLDFPVQANNGEIVSAQGQSHVIRNIPMTQKDYVFILPELRDEAKSWIEKEKNTIFENASHGENEDG